MIAVETRWRILNEVNRARNENPHRRPLSILACGFVR
jgi:hypothetical protein